MIVKREREREEGRGRGRKKRRGCEHEAAGLTEREGNKELKSTLYYRWQLWSTKLQRERRKGDSVNYSTS